MNEIQILQINFRRMNKVLESKGGVGVFGTKEQWSDTFEIRDFYKDGVGESQLD